MITKNGQQQPNKLNKITSAQKTAQFANDFTGIMSDLSNFKEGKTGTQRIQAAANLASKIMAVSGGGS